MAGRYLLTSHADYEELRNRVGYGIELSRRFPDSVFCRPRGRVLFCEYDAVFGESFWTVLRKVASFHGDTHVDFLTVDPDSESYFVREYGAYAAFSLDIRASGKDYCDAVMENEIGDETGAIYLGSYIFAVAGKSAHWGCWGERATGVAALRGAPDPDVERWESGDLPFWTASGVLEDVVSLEFLKTGIPEEFSSSFLRNYES